MSTQGRWARAECGASSGNPAGEPADGAGRGRIIPALLALYLTPALLVVLLVGAIGMLVLAIARAITSMVHGPGAWPSNPVGPGPSTR